MKQRGCVGVKLDCGTSICLLMYADDVTLLSISLARGQAQLNALLQYANMKDLKVNILKTKSMVMTKSKDYTDPEFTYNDQEVKLVPAFKYLGTKFHGPAPNWNATAETRMVVATGKASKLLQRCNQIPIRDVKIRKHLSSADVTPACLYGCETWAR